MRYYASKSTGFRPSLKTIDDEIHVGVKNISRIRQYLVGWGLIGYNGSHITIDWLRLKAYAAMEPPLMGKKCNWRIPPMPVEPEIKNEVHTYKERESNDEKRLRAAYVATAQAILDGVQFPELRGKELPTIDPACLHEVKNEVHTYIGVENSGSWYNPFNEPDPEWVNQEPVYDDSGNVVGYEHYNTVLPF